MLVSHRWLTELVPGLAETPEQVADRLSAAGLAVDGLKPFAKGLDQVLVSQVKAVEPHPRKSGLKLVEVDRGRGRERVVCGAANVPEAGGLVVLAPLGAKLAAFGGAPLTAREIGGVPSHGMLCSEAELGLSDVSEGIWVLESGSALPGTPLSDVFPKASDTIYAIDVTPNRPDALGHVGVARDVSALYGFDFTFPEVGTPARSADEPLEALVQVDNQAPDRCPHYAAGVVLEVRVGRSPEWLRFRLLSLGIRPISNVVDITNLLLSEFGQPLHAFDLERVRGRRIIVRGARPGEPFVTLDGVERELTEDDLVIADAEGPSALAGVMGGLDSEIRVDTQSVLLECAYFAPRGIRRSARRHALHTESSHRFERGVDFMAVPHVLERAKVLLTELASGQAVSGRIDAMGTLPKLPKIRLRGSRINALLGTDLPFERATELLSRLKLKVVDVRVDEPSAQIEGASFRPDLSREVDLIEEVARLHGLDQISPRLPAIVPQTRSSAGRLERELADHAVALGLSQALTYAFVAPRELAAIDAPRPVVHLENPLSEARSVMRTSLLPGLLEALSGARRRGEWNARLFAIGTCFLKPNGAREQNASRARTDGDRGVLPEERPAFAAVLAGARPEYLAEKPNELDVYDAKGVALELISRLTGFEAQLVFKPNQQGTRHLHPRGAAEIQAQGRAVGVLGPLHPNVLGALGLDGSAEVVELDLAALESLGKRVPRFVPIPRLPAVVRDLSLVVSDAISAGDVERILREAAGELCESVELVSVFRGGSVPAEHRSLTYRLVYRDPKAASAPELARTLTEPEVEARQSRVVQAVSERLGATLRV